MAIKIQINSLAALESLFKAEGGGSEIELSVKERIIEEFAKKHIKCLSNEFIKNSVSGLIIQEMNSKLIKAEVSNYKTSYTIIDNVIKESITLKIDVIRKDMEEKVKSNMEAIRMNAKVQLDLFTQRIEKDLRDNLASIKTQLETKYSEVAVKNAAIDLLNEAFYKGAEQIKKEEKA